MSTVAEVTVMVDVAGAVVGEAIVAVIVGGTVGETGVSVGVMGVPVAGRVAVIVGV
jgi:hypothetical protein